MKSAKLILIVALSMAACGPSESKDSVVVINNGGGNNGGNNGGGNNGGGNNGSNNGTETADEALVQGITAPQDAKDAADGALSLTVEAAVVASVQANGGNELVTTGTLTQSGQSFTYSATPTDRLVIQWTEGPATELTIQRLEGNFDVESIDAFFGENHVVAVTIVRDGFVNAEVASGKNGGDREGGIVGSMTVDGVTYQVDLREVGATVSDIGSTIEYESESNMTGTITAPGLSLQAQETHTFKSVYVDNFVVNRTRSANSVWTYNGVEYAMQNLFIRTATTNAYPDDLDFWRVEGVITRDGIVVGEVTYEVDQFKIYIFVLLEDGERVMLDSFMRQQ